MNMEPSDRDIALVFQSYALYPAMTVRKNVTFGLEQRKTPKEKIEEALNDVSKFITNNTTIRQKTFPIIWWSKTTSCYG